MGERMTPDSHQGDSVEEIRSKRRGGRLPLLRRHHAATEVDPVALRAGTRFSWHEVAPQRERRDAASVASTSGCTTSCDSEARTGGSAPATGPGCAPTPSTCSTSRTRRGPCSPAPSGGVHRASCRPTAVWRGWSMGSGSSSPTTTGASPIGAWRRGTTPSSTGRIQQGLRNEGFDRRAPVAQDDEAIRPDGGQGNGSTSERIAI